MARRKARRGRKIQPVPTTLTFDLGEVSKTVEGPNPPPTQATYYIDLSQCASLVARKFLRQGMVWGVSGMKLNSVNVVTGTSTPVSDSPEGSVMISKLPTSWVFSNAWEKGFHAWNDMNNDALENAESIKPKFTDFKIYMDSGHHAAGVGNNLLPVVGQQFSWTPATAGTWDMSEISIPTSGATGNATDFEVIGVGASFPGAAPGSGLNAVSLIEGYASSRGLPDIIDPNTPGDADDVGPTGTPENWIGAIRNEGTEQNLDVLDNLQDQNIRAPYPFENDTVHVDTMYPGGANQLSGVEVATIENITGSTVGGVTYLQGNTFPCGLIKIDVFNNDQTFDMYNVLQIELSPGPARGYMALPMQEM